MGETAPRISTSGGHSAGTSKEMTAVTEQENKRHEEDMKKIKDYESLDYDMCYNEPQIELLEQYGQKQRCLMVSRPGTYYHGLMEWILVFLIGAGTGMVAFGIDFFVTKLATVKFDTTKRYVETFQPQGKLIICVLLITSFNLVYGIIAALLTSIEPVAAGSGIPEIKCYLNGVKVRNVGRLKTLVAKAVGVLFSVSGGYLVGKEGPMIHSGAILGAGIPQLQSVTFERLDLKYRVFRSDRYKRDFVSAGAAAGVAAAFGAPIGGTLFSLEEGSSFWNQALTWKVFFCAMTSAFFLNLCRQTVYHSRQWFKVGSLGLLDFGQFTCGDNCRLWSVTDLAIFIVMGCVGGLLGALFNSINTRLTIYRLKHLAKRHAVVRFLEAVLIGLVTSVLTFGSTLSLSSCVKMCNDTINPPSTIPNHDIYTHRRHYLCPENSTFNDLGSLFLNVEEMAIKQLFHEPSSFSITSLVAFFILFFILAVWTYGAGVPSGLFVPCLSIGAAYGRLVGELLKMAGYSDSYAGSFALIGAASFLGGVVRMTISLCVIMIESTNEISYGLPIMAVLMVAKWVGDRFNYGLYDVHVEVKKVPFLEWESPLNMHSLKAEDIMEPELKYLYPHTKVQSICDHLKTTRHNAFPIVTTTNYENLARLPKLPTVDQSRKELVRSDEEPPTLTRRQRAFTIDSRRNYRIYSQHLDMKHQLSGAEMASLDRGDHNAMVMRHGRVRAQTLSDDSTFSKRAPACDMDSHRKPLVSPNAEIFDLSVGHPQVQSDDSAHSCSPDPVSSHDHDDDDGNDNGNEVFDSTQGDEKIKSGESRKVLMFHGIILRSQLVTLLKNRIWFNADQTSSSQRQLSHREMTEQYPRYSDIYDIDIKPEDMKNKIMDVTRYMNPCPYTILPLAPLPYVFNLFRTMGLRHLVVVDSHGQAIGMITRHNLTHDFLHQRMTELNPTKHV